MTNALSPSIKPARILYIASDERFFASHFLHIADAAQAAGNIAALAANADKNNVIDRQRLAFYPLAFDRKDRSLLNQLKILPDLYKAMRDFKPDLVHVIGLHAILILAPFLALFSKAKLVLAPIGLGRFWIEQSFKAKMMRLIIRFCLRLLRAEKIFYVFENEEDAAELGFDIYPRRQFVGGAGIDEKDFKVQPFPPPPVKAAVVARMLHSKGILEAVDAVRIARTMGSNIMLDLWGGPDEGNAGSLTENELQSLSHDGVTWHGETNDIKAVWRSSHIAVLLSAREGLPKSLLEAAACGRPIVTNDVPGCRALVRDGVEGFLVPLNNADAAARVIMQLAEDDLLRRAMGTHARARIENGFTQSHVQISMLRLYEKALKS
ncbi:MAG: glycosyltransferase [Pseudomonadota bacterium]